MRSLWYPSAVRRQGPMWKTSGLHNPFAAVYHSSEGFFNSDMNILDGAIESSWHLYNPRSGFMLQHYPLNLLTWHARGFNRESIGVENEGFAAHPLTPSQVQNLRDFSRWLVEEQWLEKLTRGGDNQTLWEHNEVGQRKADPTYTTACPSNRIPWEVIIEEEEEDEMRPILIKTEGSTTVYITDLLRIAPVPDEQTMNEFAYVGARTNNGRAFVVKQEFIDAIYGGQYHGVRLEDIGIGVVRGTFEGELS